MSLEVVNRLGREEFVSRFGTVFESSPWVAERAWEVRPFGGLSGLHLVMVEAVSEAPV
jgi:2-oxo-4-hydroxy-4-carboxy-5-ureidoimidazoline decarboxylase